MQHKMDEDLITQSWITMIYNDMHRKPDAALPPYYFILNTICKNNPHYMNLLFCIIAETRDYQMGRGEAECIFPLVEMWMEYNAGYTIDALFNMYASGIGCWKDLKKWCHDMHKRDRVKYAPAIQRIVEKMNEQLYADAVEPDANKRSNIAKWIPREKSKYGGWLYDELAADWCRPYSVYNMNMNKCRRDYRRVLSAMHAQAMPHEKTLQQVQLKAAEPMEKLVKKTTQCFGFEVQGIEEAWHSCMYSVVQQDAKNMLIVLLPSADPRHFEIQIAVLCQAMYSSNRKRFAVMRAGVGIPEILDWSGKSWTETVDALWGIHKAEKQQERDPVTCDFEGLLIAFQYLANTVKKGVSEEAVERMTWFWISEFNVSQTVHSTQFLPFWRRSVGKTEMPHMVYCVTSTEYYMHSTKRTFPCSVNDKRTTFLTAGPNGLSGHHWNNIANVTRCRLRRNNTCWENIETVLDNYSYLFQPGE